MTISDRHLGLVTAIEQGTGELYDRLAKAAAETVDLDRVEALAQDVRGEALGVRGKRDSAGQDQNRHTPHRVRIGVAYDQAFCFYYPENLELLETGGGGIGEIVAHERSGFAGCRHALFRRRLSGTSCRAIGWEYRHANGNQEIF